MRYLSFAFILFVFGAILSGDNLRAQEPTPPPTDSAAKVIQVNALKKDERYRIGLHDVLEINIYKHPELSLANVRLNEEGKVRLPHPQQKIEVVALCKTENEIAVEIEDAYKTYLRNPSVSIFVKEQNSQPLSVIGAVEKPGSFFTNRRLTLLELLSFAGGQDVEKAGTRVQVARVGEISGCGNSNAVETTEREGITFFVYKLEDVLTGKTNPVMRPGDIVVVLEVEQVYVTGNVVKPQAIPLKEKVTLTQAIAAAGGVLPATKRSEVTIVRQEMGSSNKKELKFDLVAIKDRKIADPELMPNDIVDVPTDKVKDFRNNFIKAVTGGIGNIFYRIPL